MLALRPTRRALLTAPFKRRCLSSSSFPDPLQPATPPDDGPQPPYKMLFFGADTFSCRVLERVHQAGPGLVDQITVVTPGDQRVGRKLKEVRRPPLREYAEELGLARIALPPTLLKGWQPPAAFLPPPTSPIATAPSAANLLLTASFGHLIPSPLLSLFRPLNALNVHPSLLPKYRGASPIQYGILNGDADEGGDGMGVTVQELSRGRFDRGRILGQTPVDVPSDLTFLELEPILARAGGDLVVSILRDLAAAQAAAFPQNPSLATLAPKLHKANAQVRWSQQPPLEVVRLQRGIGHQYPLWTTYTPPPTSLTDSSPASPAQLQLTLTPFLSPLPSTLVYAPAGTVALDPQTKTLVVKCADSKVGVEVERVKKEGGKWVMGREWWNGLGKKAREEGVVFE
ncbi:hypothetical protein JCM6882_005785 [Rhodosporidiobolus microsporus]